MDIDFLVRVSCMTYNHAPYIEDAMNGFCMQETSFPFVCTIVDDASTDGEQEVIKKYLQENFDLQDKSTVRNEETDDYVLTFARHKTNTNCYFAVLYLKYNHYRKKSKAPYIQEWLNSKYIAVCEGDDYWTDPLKLQKQVNILNQSPNIFMVYSNYLTVNERKEIIERPQYDYYKSLSHSGDILPTLFKSNFPLTLTVMLRPEVYATPFYLNAPATIDYLLFVSAAFLGDAYYLKECTASYRLSPNGMMVSNQEKIRSIYNKVYPYVVHEYVKGNAKRMKFRDNIVAKHNIMHKSWNTYPFLIKELLKIKPFYAFFLITVLVEKVCNRMFSILQKLTNKVWNK